MNEDLTLANISTSWHSYPKIYALGHRYIHEILQGEVTVEEKVDGSQFSFALIDGEVKCRSKGAVLNTLAPEKMFIQAVEAVSAVKDNLTPGWTYRAEYLARPKHNSLAYERRPENYLIGFDINTGHEEYLSYVNKRIEFERLGFETVPILLSGVIEDYSHFRALLDTMSCLGGQKVEGVVIKNYSKFLPDGKVMMGKFVSEAFKEIHAGDWRERNPGRADFLDGLVNQYATPARWNKAIFRLRDAGELEGSPRDIGKLIKDIPNDVKAECEVEIRDKLFEHFWDQIRRQITSGFPQYYKEMLAKEAFEPEKGEGNE